MACPLWRHICRSNDRCDCATNCILFQRCLGTWLALRLYLSFTLDMPVTRSQIRSASAEKSSEEELVPLMPNTSVKSGRTRNTGSASKALNGNSSPAVVCKHGPFDVSVGRCNCLICWQCETTPCPLSTHQGVRQKRQELGRTHVLRLDHNLRLLYPWGGT